MREEYRKIIRVLKIPLNRKIEKNIVLYLAIYIRQQVVRC